MDSYHGIVLAMAIWSELSSEQGHLHVTDGVWW